MLATSAASFAVGAGAVRTAAASAAIPPVAALAAAASAGLTALAAAAAAAPAAAWPASTGVRMSVCVCVCVFMCPGGYPMLCGTLLASIFNVKPHKAFNLLLMHAVLSQVGPVGYVQCVWISLCDLKDVCT